MQYNIRTDIDLGVDKISKSRDSITLDFSNKLQKSNDYIDSVNYELEVISDYIDKNKVKQSLINQNRIKSYEKISSSSIDSVYVSIKSYLDSIEIPKQ